MPVPGPTVRALLRFHYMCLQGMYFSEFHAGIEGGSLLFSDKVTDPYYNFFAPEVPMAVLGLPEGLEDEFTRRGRQPTVYLTPEASATPGDRQSGPAIEDARVWARDAWMVGDAASLAAPAEEAAPGASMNLRSVGPAERDAYVATFTEAYSGDAPDDPYGQLDTAYSESLAASFDADVPGFRKHYVMASDDERPVGVAVMFTGGALAGVYGVGTVPTHRKAGVGSAMMAHLARIAVDDEASHVMLQTEAGSSVQRWYEKLGYRHAFDAAYVNLGEEPRT